MSPKTLLLLCLLVLLGLTDSASSQPLAPPTTDVILGPAYAGGILRGSAAFSDPDGDLEGISAYRWLVNGGQVAAGEVPQSMLLPLDGDLLSSDSQAPVESQGLAFVAGRFGQALQTSAVAESRLAYPAAGNVDPDEGSLEMWVNLAYDLDHPAYNSNRYLFYYVIDDEHQLILKAISNRIIFYSRNEGTSYDAWPDPPGWRGDEWHHLAATWSASESHLAVYYDCVLVSEGDFIPPTGRASSFDLGSAAGWGVMEAAFDEVRLSRRALRADEITAACERRGPAPNDEVVLPPGQANAGDMVTFELTPCDQAGACGSPANASAIVEAPPLGALAPAPGLLPSGTISVTLSLTTTVPADCRWSEGPDTPYEGMAHEFQGGQATTAHSTVVEGLSDLDERWFYVRCADLGSPPQRDPDAYERWTHLRLLGPWDGGYPRIANLWGIYDPASGVDFFAGYDLFVPSWWGGGPNQAAAIRALNPNAKVLLSQNATYGWPESDPLTAKWWDSSPGEPGYNCLLRDSSSNILLVLDHPMYNLTQPDCRTLLVQQNLDVFLSRRPDQGDELAYDGIYWDRLEASISWLGDDIDGDMNGQPDDPTALDATYQAGVEDFLNQVRARLPNILIMGNDAPQVDTPWLNGRLYEWQMAAILDGVDWLSWDAVMTDYRDWTGRGNTPRTTFIQSAPENLYRQKFSRQHLDKMSPAMEAEAAASYRRMRFGLTTALMGDGLFSYDLGISHGDLWWYDEFGNPGGIQVPLAVTLQPHGYLGQPTVDPFLLLDTLNTPDQVTNGGFDDGLNGWNWWVDGGVGAAATFDVDASGGVSGTAAAHIIVTCAAQKEAVQFRQFGLATEIGQTYTLSFWARSDKTRTLYASIVKQTSPWTNYGFNVQAIVTPQWQHYHLWDDFNVTVDDARLEFLLGDAVGELWLDDVQFQSGALGVWGRSFENGLAVVNSTNDVQKVPLPDTYCKLNGDQAPLFQVRVDDDQAQSSPGWSQQAANYDQFGATVQLASAGSAATVTYTPTLAYGGAYEVLAWVAPTGTQSSAAPVTIRHAGGETLVFLDQTTGEVGWRSLGTYTFEAGENGSAVLAAADEGAVVADAFKWSSTARYNDGGYVRRLTLQPQDGIILMLPCSNAPDLHIYLPIVVRR